MSTNSLASGLLRRLQFSSLLRRNETNSEVGRSKERYRRAFLTTFSAGFSRLVAIVTGLISVPLTLHYLGVERYGLWMTISSIIAFLGFSDLGISNALLNGISTAYGNNNRTMAREYVSTAIFLLAAVAAILGLAFVLSYRWINWTSFLHVRSAQATAEAGPAMATFVFCFLISIPVNIITKIQSGYQEGFTANLWASAGSLSAFLCLLLVIRVHGSLALLVVALAGLPLLATIINGFWLFIFQRPWLAPSMASVRRTVLKELFGSGSLFLFLQIATAVGYSSDNIVIANILGPEAVTQYSVPARMFGLTSMLCMIAAGPLWPAYTEALVKNDIVWIKRALARSLFIVIAVAVGLSTLFTAYGREIITLWVGPKVHPPLALLLALSCWSVLSALSVPVAMLLNAANVVGFQVIASGLATTMNICLSIFLTRRLGIIGVVLGSAISQVCVLVPYFLYLYRFTRSLDRPAVVFASENSPA